MNTVNALPHPIIETNIRTVYLHHFFSNKNNVADKEIFIKIKATIQKGCTLENPREWQYALMDYGSYLKKNCGNHNAKQSAHHRKQIAFKGSRRELQSAIIHSVSAGEKNTSIKKLKKIYERHPQIKNFDSIVTDLINEEMIIKKNQSLSIA